MIGQIFQQIQNGITAAQTAIQAAVGTLGSDAGITIKNTATEQVINPIKQTIGGITTTVQAAGGATGGAASDLGQQIEQGIAQAGQNVSTGITSAETTAFNEIKQGAVWAVLVLVLVIGVIGLVIPSDNQLPIVVPE